jgi:hypothetical protein
MITITLLTIAITLLSRLLPHAPRLLPRILACLPHCLLPRAHLLADSLARVAGSVAGSISSIPSSIACRFALALALVAVVPPTRIRPRHDLRKVTRVATHMVRKRRAGALEKRECPPTVLLRAAAAASPSAPAAAVLVIGRAGGGGGNRWLRGKRRLRGGRRARVVRPPKEDLDFRLRLGSAVSVSPSFTSTSAPSSPVPVSTPASARATHRLSIRLVVIPQNLEGQLETPGLKADSVALRAFREVPRGGRGVPVRPLVYGRRANFSRQRRVRNQHGGARLVAPPLCGFLGAHNGREERRSAQHARDPFGWRGSRAGGCGRRALHLALEAQPAPLLVVRACLDCDARVCRDGAPVPRSVLHEPGGRARSLSHGRVALLEHVEGADRVEWDNHLEATLHEAAYTAGRPHKRRDIDDGNAPLELRLRVGGR